MQFCEKMACTVRSSARAASYKDQGFDTFLAEQPEKVQTARCALASADGAGAEHSSDERIQRNRPIYKIVILSMRKEQLEEPVRVLGDRVKFCVQGEDSYGYINGELHGPEFDKGSGVRAVCEALSLSTEDSIAFGDSMNDVEMIEASGLGICMENGYEELKKLADDICPSVEDDGIYRAFEKYGLIGKMA